MRHLRIMFQTCFLAGWMTVLGLTAGEPVIPDRPLPDVRPRTGRSAIVVPAAEGVAKPADPQTAPVKVGTPVTPDKTGTKPASGKTPPPKPKAPETTPAVTVTPADNGTPAEATGPRPGPDDTILLVNGHRLSAIVMDGDRDPANPHLTVRTRAGGTMLLAKSMVAKVEESFERRVARLAADDYQGHLELARWAMAKERHTDALALLEKFKDSSSLDLEGLRLLGMLIDILHTPDRIQEAIGFYRRYQEGGGKDRMVLDRLAELEKTLADYQKQVQDYQQKRETNRREDGHEVEPGWAADDPNYANPIETTVVEVPGGIADKVMQLTYKPGDPSKKAALKKRWKIDARTNSLLAMQVSNPNKSPVRLSIALKVGGNWEYFETRPYDVPADNQWHQVNFDLAGKDFKSQASNWAHSVGLSDRGDINELQIQVWNGASAGTIYINDMGFTTPTAPPPAPPKADENKSGRVGRGTAEKPDGVAPVVPVEVPVEKPVEKPVPPPGE